jgi:bifunctional DNase/RNase
MTEVTLARMARDSATGAYVVVLQERDGRRLLPIWIGRPEAEAIALHVNGVVRPRPLTHDLCTALIESLGGTLERVDITRVVEGTYCAELHIGASGGHVVVDARPSDSIAIALRLGAPLFALDALLTTPEPDAEDEVEGLDRPDHQPDAPEAAAERPSGLPAPRGEMTPDALKAYLAELRPEDFGKYRP